MKKILLFASALAGLFLAGSCQRENLEPVATGITYEISLPEVVQTKADGHQYDEYDLYYEVYKTVSATDLADPKTKPLFENKVTMTGNTHTLSLDLLNDQDYTILFWANKKENYYFVLDDLRNVGIKEASSNNDDRDAFCGKDQISQHDGAMSKTVELKRPFAQVNIATVVKSVGYDINPISSLVKFTKIPTAYNVLDEEQVGANAEVTYGVNWVPEGNLDVAGVSETYKKVAMNYILVPEGTVDVYYEINTANGTVKNTIGNVPVKKNYRTNIIGNLLTSNATYTIELKPGFEQADEMVEVVSVSTAAELVAALTPAAGSTPVEGESTNIKLEGDIDLSQIAGLLSTKASDNLTLTIPAGREVTLDLNGYSLTAFDSTEKNYSVIDNRGTLTVTNSNKSKTSKISVEAGVNSGWNRYSAVLANNPGGKLTVCAGVELEHLGGTDMAYGIDNLTNGKGTYAVTVIDGATVKSPYRAVRQFLNGAEATNELYVKAGSVLEGANKSIFFHDPSTGANTGKLVVDPEAQLKGDVYLFVTAGSTEWPVDVTIAKAALVGESEVISGNVPEQYELVDANGVLTVEKTWIENGDEVVLMSAKALEFFATKVNAGESFEGKTVKLGADIDLNNKEWTPIGSATQDHGFCGNFDGNNKTIKNLKITAVTPDSDGYAYIGLFGITENNYIKDFTIENVNIQSTGAIVSAAIAYPYYTTVENITVKGDINIKGGDYTAGVLAYTRRCVNAKNLAIVGNSDSVIEGNMTVGGVISDIQMNGGLTAAYSNFSASGLTIKGVMHVGGVSGIICEQTLDGATVENVSVVCEDNRKGIVAGSKGGWYTLTKVSYENITGATRVVGATFKEGYYPGQIIEVAGAKAIIYTIDNDVKAVSVEELNLKGKNWSDAMTWAENLGGHLASIDELDAIHAVRFDLNDVLEADNSENALFEEDDYYADGKYALYLSSTEATGNDPQGEAYFSNRVHLKYFNLNGYWDYPLSTLATINKSAPLKDNYFARAVFTL